MIAKAGKPVDKDEWLMTPQTVNAYYNPTTNEICFPAAILQAPFFDSPHPEGSVAPPKVRGCFPFSEFPNLYIT